ncbi:carbohydrate ABC transporter permease [Lacrimispora saccharolytica]|uniref:Binding-protein-dependent transport systems inner membrane component n=1 Tax=Lacrimispora saccharolytica (strain ATCC 35040 / DSM 2544 / NRCC 2533 / WM1) TaxID=610130 RepID=D9RAX1_LACSW|nr:sugar ABC transporter permease [Lacrimispora saccharolytica]ADL06168.1 binding-protein-dependent transport systems inner membrane component [[Clostridium] saccharolyticum WM1]QRV19724.1 sugar ABC transporter permease [Lacrimispora saccharolytica]
MKRERKRNLQAFAFVFPGILILGIFVYYPLFKNIVYSFQSFTLSDITKEWVGLANYRQLFHDKIIFVSLKNNFLYAVISILIQVGFGLILAAVLEDVAFRKVAPALRSIYFIPTVISMTVVCLLFDFIYNPQMGLLNSFLNLLGLDQLAHIWLGSKKTAMYAVIAVSQWQSTGYVAMLFIVAIQKIPTELYESAEVDGAGKFKRFFYITVPQVRQMFFVTMILTVVGAFTVFNEPYILTGGGPGTSTMVLSLHMYQTGFVKNNMGYASTIAMLIFVITAVLSSVQFFTYGTDKEERT